MCGRILKHGVLDQSDEEANVGLKDKETRGYDSVVSTAFKSCLRVDAGMRMSAFGSSNVLNNILYCETLLMKVLTDDVTLPYGFLANLREIMISTPIMRLKGAYDGNVHWSNVSDCSRTTS